MSSKAADNYSGWLLGARGFFVTGTDTNVGKTVLSSVLCAALNAAYWKPIQTGCSEGTDRDTVRRIAKLPSEDLLPEGFRFRDPVSPHLASKRCGETIDFRNLTLPSVAAGKQLIVEGAGGVLVPINERELMVDLMARLRLPVILAARGTLGTINHTLLSLLAIRQRNVAVLGVVLMGAEEEGNRSAIEHYGNAPVIGSVPFLEELSREVLVRIFDANFAKERFK